MQTAKLDSIYLNILHSGSEPILYEENDWFVLLAKQPCNEGHLLVVPKIKKSKFYDLPQYVSDRGFRICIILSKVLDDIYHPPRVALFIKGFSNDSHAHIHLVPAYKSEDLDKDLSRHELNLKEMRYLCSKLAPAINEKLIGTRLA